MREPECQRGIKRENSSEDRGREPGQPCPHLAVDVEADVNPRDSSNEPTHSECESKRRGAARGRGAQRQREQAGQRKKLQPPEVPGRKRKRVCDTQYGGLQDASHQRIAAKCEAKARHAASAGRKTAAV